MVLLVAYGLLSLLNSPDAFLGTDTGAKVYTLEAMSERGSVEPDIGYWAEDLDPDGDLHPIVHSVAVDGGWVAVTTLPMLELGLPLYAVGGYRAALVIPMLSAVAVALGARALSRRIDDESTGMAAFWVVGLASPMVVYALDFWEHAAGVACVVWAVALLDGVLEDGRSWAMACLAGLLLGLGAAMRNEVLVYALVATATACVTLLIRRRSLLPPAVLGAATSAGFALSLLANAMLESLVNGRSRTARTTGTASSAVGGSRGFDDLGTRVEEGLQTSIGLVSGAPVTSAFLGGGIVLAVFVAARAERRGDRTFAVVCLVAGACVYVADAVGGLGFIPGLFVAFPIALLAAVPRGLTPTARMATVVAVASLPIVYLFQYLGGAGPQWGGRYTLPSAILLGVVALPVLRTHLPVVGRGAVALSVLASGIGVAWVSVRTNDVDDFFDDLIATSEPILISRQAFLLREGGAEISAQRWLSTVDEATFSEAVRVARQTGEEGFSVLEWNGDAPPDAVLPDDTVEIERRRTDFLGTPVGVVTYRFTN